MNSIETSKFSIQANTYTLRGKNGSTKNCIIDADVLLEIPIYQRPYSWSEDQVSQLIQDIFKSFYGADRKSPSEPMFIGTMQLSANESNNGSIQKKQKIIDGQQRLSTLLVLLKLLRSLFPDTDSLKEINFDWLLTKVNNGEQQNLLNEFLQKDITQNFNEEQLNKYLQNSMVLKGYLEDHIYNNDEYESTFNLEKFIKYLLDDVYFVVIETNAGLSKTLQIFDAINTTGLDLNGGDVFKIRMYEYLTSKRNYGEDAFNKISELYATVDAFNHSNYERIDFLEVLGTYQHFLIAKYALPQALHELASYTFYDRLFDTILGMKEWPNFSNVYSNGLVLDLDELSKFINIHRKWVMIAWPTHEDFALRKLFSWSRYGRHKQLLFLYLFQFGETEIKEGSFFYFMKMLSRIFLVYSVIFDKGINNLHSFVYGLKTKLIKNNVSKEDLIKKIKDKLNSDVQAWNKPAKEVFREVVSGNIFYNGKKKGLLCWLSAFLEEPDAFTAFNKESVIIQLFQRGLDVEHIEAFNHKDEMERQLIQEKWSSSLNSIGNLMVLEYDINRGGASNNPYEIKIKDEVYGKSKFAIVSNLVSEFPVWNLENCKQRKLKELDKLEKYIFKMTH